MKTLSAASRALCYSALFWGIFSATPLSAQVSYNYNQPPPPGYPAAGTTPKTSTRATRQSAAAVQAPVTYAPPYPGTYPPPPGFTYPPPPGYGTKPATKPTTSTKTSSKSSGSSKKSTAGPPPPPASKVYGPTGDLSTQVAKLKDSDKVQNLRLGELERDVSSIKRGKSSSRYDGGTDLAAHTTYVARPGDTLWRIASTHRVSVGEIQQLNRMTEEEVRVGQTLLIPSPHRLSSALTQASYKPSTPGSSSSATTTTTSTLSYTVKKGDSLKAIAIKHKMTTAALAAANRIKDPNKIVVGQRLKIPGRTVTIASTPRSTPPSQDNPDTVPLPGFGMNEAPPPPPAAGLAPTNAPASPAKPAAAANDTHRGILAYRVDGSDTLESIAHQFSTTPQHIREMNRMDATMKLKNGDEIMVPAMGAVSVSR